MTEGAPVPLVAEAYVEGTLLPVFCNDRGLRIDLPFMMTDENPVACPALARGRRPVVVWTREGG